MVVVVVVVSMVGEGGVGMQSAIVMIGTGCDLQRDEIGMTMNIITASHSVIGTWEVIGFVG